MSRNYSIYLADILDAIDRIEEYTQNIAFDDFKKDRMRFDAVIRNMFASLSGLQRTVNHKSRNYR